MLSDSKSQLTKQAAAWLPWHWLHRAQFMQGGSECSMTSARALNSG